MIVPKVQKMTIFGEKIKNRRLGDFHKSEKVNILGEKKKKSTRSGMSKKMTILGQKTKQKKREVA